MEKTVYYNGLANLVAKLESRRKAELENEIVRANETILAAQLLAGQGFDLDLESDYGLTYVNRKVEPADLAKIFRALGKVKYTGMSPATDDARTRMVRKNFKVEDYPHIGFYYETRLPRGKHRACQLKRTTTHSVSLVCKNA